MDKFLSCDWGTSSFRLRLVLADKLTVVAELKNVQGIAATYKAWQQSGNPAGREAFFIDFIKKQIKVLNRQVGMPLDGIPVIVSGMASSSIGLSEVPYKNMPFKLDGSDLEVKVLEGEDINRIIIISGVCTNTDVMRGEETKTIGCAHYLIDKEIDKLLILPGTHPKHITLKNNIATGVITYMTGEFFNLLATKSVLAASVEEGGHIKDTANRESFTAGVKAGRTDNLLHSAFMVRTNQLLKQLPKQQNFYYLSGLLIGAELKDIQHGTALYLVGVKVHLSLYKLACEVLGIAIAGLIDADDALIKGQQAVFVRYYPR